jgi:dCTP deaminase
MLFAGRGMNGDFNGSAPAGDLTPSQHLRDEMQRLDLDQQALANELGVSRQIVNYVLNDKQRISRAMAEKLGELMGVGPDYWLRSSFPGGAPSLRRPGGVTGSAVLVDHQLRRAIEARDITLVPFDPQRINPASIDLTVGEHVIDMSGAATQISRDEPYSLRHGHSVNLATAEVVGLTARYVGRVGGTTELAKLGLILSHGFQVDPGFRGVLEFSLFNGGSNDFVIAPGLPIISLEVCALLEEPRETYPEKGFRLDATRPQTRKQLQAGEAEKLMRAFLQAEFARVAACEQDGAYYVASLDGLAAPCRSKSKEDALSNCAAMAAQRLMVSARNTVSGSYGEIAEAFDRHAGKILLDRDALARWCSALRADLGEGGLVIWGDQRHVVSLPNSGAYVGLDAICMEMGASPSSLLASIF